MDDDVDVRAVLSEAFTTWGSVVTPADAGDRGLERLQNENFDVAIIDLRMPGMGGAELCERARGLDLKLPALIFSTGDAVSPQARAFLDRSGAPILEKRFTLRALGDLVERALPTPTRTWPTPTHAGAGRTSRT